MEYYCGCQYHIGSARGDDAMREVYKPNGDESGPDYIVDLEGPDGNVYVLYGLIDKLLGPECIDEAQKGEHYSNPDDCPTEGYERILDYRLSMMPQIEFRMYGRLVGQVSDFNNALYEAQGE